MDLTQNDNEAERISDLKSYGILDTDPEVTFDQLTFLAAQACSTPISLLSFIDTDRQWFKSTYGIELHEIPRHISACNATIRQDGIYEIQDAARNDCPYSQYMLDHGYRYYAGVPVRSKYGHNVGSLCVIDYKPRSLSREQGHVLKVISQQVVDLMELRLEYENNLKELKHIGEVSFRREGHLQDVAHKAGMRAMAELSAGLIYRLRPMAAAIQIATRRIEETDENHNMDLKLIYDSSFRITSILESLEKFIAAEREKWMKPLELNTVIESVLNHLEYKFKHFDIKLEVNLERDIRCIGNISQITEAVFAVVNNAIEAVEDLKDRKIKVELKEEDHCAQIYVSDSGRGVPESIRPFIFQPLFTTKKSMSLGVGLSLAQGLIQRHSGDIELVRPYGPTIFKIKIPVP